MRGDDIPVARAVSLLTPGRAERGSCALRAAT
jgi:hypothetical protein